MTPEDEAKRIAERIADGSGLDWPADANAASSHDRGVLEALKAIADVASAHRAPTGPADASSLAGTRWGPLTIVTLVARGGFSEVYRAWEPRLQREVALKLLDAPSPETASLPTRAIEEARLLARVRHPNVLTVYGAESIEGRVGIWTEFIDGRTLDALVRERGFLTPDEVVAIGFDLCRALAAVHGAGLLHRDIKAHNVMRETGGRIVLMDFGTGQDLTRVRPREGDLTGTPLYLAPEIFAGGRPSVASDIYALGVLLFYLATGDYPVPGRTLAEVQKAHDSDVHVTVRDRRPDVPKTLAVAIERAISPNPAARFESAAAFEHALANADPRRHTRVRRRTWWFAAAVLLIAAIVGLGWWRSSVLARPTGFHQRDWVLLTTFDNRTSDQQFDRTVEDALAYELSNSTYVNVVPRIRVDDALRLMSRPVDTVVDATIGLEVAQRDGAIRLVVDGAIERLGTGYVMAVQVVDPLTGVSIASDRVEVGSAAGVSAAVRQLSSWLRVTLGEAPLTVRQDTDLLAKATTPSLRAIRLYTEALYAFDRRRFDEAETSLGSALTEDPNFASAHIWMAWTLRRLNRSREDYLPSAQKAFELVSTRTERERYWILGSYYEMRGQNEAAISQYEALVYQYTDEKWALTNLMTLYNSAGRSRDVVPLMVRQADASPNDLVDQIRAASSVSEFDGIDAARPYVARARRLVPAAGTNSTTMVARATIGTLLFPAHDFWLQRRVREASAVLDAVSPRPEFDAEGIYTLNVLGSLRLTLGQLRLAEQTFDRITDPGLKAIGLSEVALARNDSAAMVKQLRAYEGNDLAAVSLLVRAGDLDGGEQLLERIRQRINDSGPMNRINFPWAAWEIQEARGNVAVIAEQIKNDLAWTEVMKGVRAFMYSETLARAGAAAGDTAGAIHVLEATAKLAEKSYGFFFNSSYYSIRIQKLRADLYRQTGQVDQARAIERDLLSALAAADADYPLLVELKKRAGS